MGLRQRIAELFGKDDLNFLAHSRNYLMSEVLVGIISFASIPILTRLLTRAEYGELSLFLSAVAVFSLLLELNLRGAIQRYWLEGTNDFRDFLATNLIFLTLLTVFNLGWIWFARAPLAEFFRLSPEVFYLAVLCSATRLPWNLSWKLLTAQQRSARYAVLNTARSAAHFAVGVTWVYLLSRDRYLGQIYALVVVGAVFAVWLGLRLVHEAWGGRFRLGHLRYALWFGIPLLPHALSGYVLDFFDRVIVAQIEGEDATGLYSLAYDVGKVMNVVVVSTNQSWQPIFIGLRAKGELGAIERLAGTYAKYVYFIAVILVLFAPEIVMAMAERRYYMAIDLIPVIVFGYVAVFLYTVYSGYSFYLRRTGWISLATLLAGGLNIALNYWAIPIWGYVAAAWTTLASYVLLFVFHYLIARFVLREPVLRLQAVLPWLAVAVAVSVAYLAVSRAIDHYWITLLAVKVPLLGLLVAAILRTRLGALRAGRG
jgi:O-antigen/teichoic acid export membrane protein